jgi:ELWxxDGT repeat protein
VSPPNLRSYAAFLFGQLLAIAATHAFAAPIKVAGNAPQPSSTINHRVVGDALYYQGSSAEGVEPWRSAGTVATTNLIRDIRVGADSAPAQFVGMGGATYFFVEQSGWELWRTEGTADSTERVASVDSQPFGLASTGNALYFFSNTSDGIGLWRSDGTQPGTVFVKGFPRMGGAPAYGFGRASNGVILFAIDDGTHGYELWATDGTPSGTSLLRDFSAGSQGSSIYNFVAVAGIVYFHVATSSGDMQLWKSDGTSSGTVAVTAMDVGVIPAFGTLTTAGGLVYFVGHDYDAGRELWRTDGTPGGTYRVKDLCPGMCNGNPSQMVTVGKLLYFVAQDEALRNGLWRSDGTAAGTYLIKEMVGPAGVVPQLLTGAANRLFFVMDDGIHGDELWFTDGTIAGTSMRGDLTPGSTPTTFAWLEGSSRGLFFSARRPDFGYDIWYDEVCGAGDADADGIPDCVELAEGRNPETKDNDVFSDARLFAMQQYRDFFNREGDEGGITYWSSQIGSNNLSRGEVIESFLGSGEFRGNVAPVVRLYSAYFRRLPDYTGLTFWIDYKRQGNSLIAISQQFAQSAEFTNRYGSLDNGQFVDLVYQNVLGRAPDAGGRAYWIGQLEAGAPRGSVMLSFSDSTEFQQVTANEVYVTIAYIGMMRRKPDQSGFDFWTGYLDAGNSGLALINGFLNSAEYRSRFLP